jgi:ATP-dependent Clp protease protease subunit
MTPIKNKQKEKNMSNTETPAIDPETTSPTGYIVFVTGEITQELADEVAKQMIVFDMQNTVKGEQLPITLIVNSPGGGLCAGWQICDVMDYIATPVYTTGLGEIASAALMIFMNGEPGHRVLTDRTSIMSHRYSWGVSGNHAELIAAESEFKNVHKRILEHYIECTGLTKAEVEEQLLRPYNVWLSPNQAIKLGLADKIFRTKKNKNVKKVKRSKKASNVVKKENKE